MCSIPNAVSSSYSILLSALPSINSVNGVKCLVPEIACFAQQPLLTIPLTFGYEMRLAVPLAFIKGFCVTIALCFAAMLGRYLMWCWLNSDYSSFPVTKSQVTVTQDWLRCKLPVFSGLLLNVIITSRLQLMPRVQFFKSYWYFGCYHFILFAMYSRLFTEQCEITRSTWWNLLSQYPVAESY